MVSQNWWSCTFHRRRRSMSKAGEALGTCSRNRNHPLLQDHHISRKLKVGRTRWKTEKWEAIVFCNLKMTWEIIWKFRRDRTIRSQLKAFLEVGLERRIEKFRPDLVRVANLAMMVWTWMSLAQEETTWSRIDQQQALPDSKTQANQQEDVV